jgi:hypothetical protein
VTLNVSTKKWVALVASIWVLGNVLAPCDLRAQPPWFTPPPTPAAQRNALNFVRSQVDWFRNATQNAPRFGTGRYGLVWNRFMMVRDAYRAFQRTLTPVQLRGAANELAELEAGLDIIQEGFIDYQQDVGSGRLADAAFRSMSQALDQAAGVWLQELDRVARQLGI